MTTAWSSDGIKCLHKNGHESLLGQSRKAASIRRLHPETCFLVQSLKGKQVTSIAKYVVYKAESTKKDDFIKTIAA